MSAKQVRPSDLVLPHQHEAIKAHFVYDAFQRLVESYTAMSEAEHGARALKTSYQYAGTSAKVLNMKEEIAQWDSAWDF